MDTLLQAAEVEANKPSSVHWHASVFPRHILPFDHVVIVQVTCPSRPNPDRVMIDGGKCSERLVDRHLSQSNVYSS